jgi:hypothetical protein
MCPKQIGGSALRVEVGRTDARQGHRLTCRIQVGLSRYIIQEQVEEWITCIADITPRVRKFYGLLQGGQPDKARRQLPPDGVYPVSAEMARRLLIENR